MPKKNFWIADNIGGATYHSKIPIPRKDVNRADIKQKKGSARLRQLVKDWNGVNYLIIDEMSMVGQCE